MRTPEKPIEQREPGRRQRHGEVRHEAPEIHGRGHGRGREQSTGAQHHERVRAEETAARSTRGRRGALAGPGCTPPRSRASKSTNKKEQLSRGGGGEIWGRWVPLARAARARRASSTACAIGGSPRRRRRHCAIVPAVRAARRRTGRRGAPLATCRHARIAAPDGPARRHLIRSRYIKKTCKEIFVRTCRRKFKSYLESASRIARSTALRVL